MTQLNYQAIGFRIFADQEVQTSLKLTDDQKSKLKLLADELAKELAESQKAVRNVAERLQKSKSLNTEYCDKAKLLLDRQQTESLQKLVGSPFDLSFLRSTR